MRTIQVEPITHEAFAPFGQFYKMEAPEGYALCGQLHQFFPDRLTADSTHRVGYSPILVKKPEKMVITQQEYHTTTWEMILPMNDDMILHVAPASAGTPVTNLAKAFLVPKHTLV
jgi:ureidoglycolate lyase